VAQKQQPQSHADQKESASHQRELPPPEPSKGKEASESKSQAVSGNKNIDPADNFALRLKKPEWVIVYITAAYTIVSLATLLVIWKQVWLTKDTARRQLRAYVVVERGIIGNVTNPIPSPREKIETVARILDPQAGPTAQITIKNTGQTPAYELVHWGDICVQDFPLTGKLPPMPPREAKFWTVMGPGIVEVKTLRLRQPLTEEQVQGLHNGTMAIYCHGEIDYRDAFKTRRVTRYRCMYSSAGGRIGVNTDLIYCDDGNDAS